MSKPNALNPKPSKSIEALNLREQLDARDDGLPRVLIPGGHAHEDGYIEQGVSEFGDQVLEHFPDNFYYRRSGQPGELTGDRGRKTWQPLTPSRMRRATDQRCRLTSRKKKRTDGHDHLIQIYHACTQDLGGVILAAAEDHLLKFPELDRIINYPAYDEQWKLIRRGFHKKSKVYYDEPADMKDIEIIRDMKKILYITDELLTDFPMRSSSDRANFIGLLLTPIIAPALGNSNRPLHLITSSLERTGKSKLAQEVLGGIIQGSQTPAMALTGSEEERDKRILSMLQAGNTLLCLDNIPGRLHSAVLSSLLTADFYQGRLLGSIKTLTLKNTLTITATGNNVQCSAEIAKRIVPIILQPLDGAPEKRTQFEHVDIRKYVKENRKVIFGCLLGMVENWLEEGMPPSDKPRPFGGFDAWARAIGGILSINGRPEWRANEDEWRDQFNEEGDSRSRLVSVWWQEAGGSLRKSKDILDICDRYEILVRIIAKPTSRGRETGMGLWLRQQVNTPIDNFIIRRIKEGNAWSYLLEKTG